MLNPYEPPNATSQADLGSDDSPASERRIWRRVAIAAGVLVLFVSAVFPGDWPMESNPFAGPLWLIVSRSASSQVIGVAITFPCLAAMGSAIVVPRWYTGLLAVLGAVVWSWIGVTISAGAAC